MRNDLSNSETNRRFPNVGTGYWRGGNPTSRLMVMDILRVEKEFRIGKKKGDGITNQIKAKAEEMGWGISVATINGTLAFLEYLKIIEVEWGKSNRGGKNPRVRVVWHEEELVEEDIRELERLGRELEKLRRWREGTRALEAAGSSLTLEEIERRYVGDSFQQTEIQPDPVHSPQEPLESLPSTFPAEESFSVADAILSRVAEILTRGEVEPVIEYRENEHDLELGSKLYHQTELYNKARARVGELEDLLYREREVVMKLNGRIGVLNRNIEAMSKENNGVVREEFEKMVHGFMTKRDNSKETE